MCRVDSNGRVEKRICARIVLYNPPVTEDVHYAVEIVKLMVNGKHLWMRKFEAKPKKLVPPCQRHGTSSAGATW